MSPILAASQRDWQINALVFEDIASRSLVTCTDVLTSLDTWSAIVTWRPAIAAGRISRSFNVCVDFLKNS